MATEDQVQSGQWHPMSWKTKPIVQDVVYDDPAHVERVVKKLNNLPPMVSPQEVWRRKSLTALAGLLMKRLWVE